MHSLVKLIFKNFKSPRSAAAVRRICVSSASRDKPPSDSNGDNQVKVPGSMSKYELFSDEDNKVILDIEEERHKIKDPEPTVYDTFKGIKLTRGEKGVFDIEELVDLLRNEKAKDIFVCEIPPEYSYADYMVIVTGRSNRHMTAMAEFVRKVFKRKADRQDRLPTVEGKNCKKWVAIDLENIVLHIFAENIRQTYDLESLWSLGKQYDSLSQTQISSILTDYSSVLSSLTPQDTTAEHLKLTQ